MTLVKAIISLILLSSLSGCVVLSTAVGVTTTVVGGVIDVVDLVTPDILDDDDDEDEEEGEENSSNDGS
jgi:hypothetical protein